MSNQPSEKRVIVIAHNQKLSSVDRNALESVGFVVIRVERPSEVRMLSSTQPPIDSNQMLKAAIAGMHSPGEAWSKDQRAAAWTALCKIAFPPEEKKP